MKTKIKWGILGPGTIANQFAKGLKHLEDAEIVAVGSRSLERAKEFATQYDIKNAYGSYEALVNDPEVDVIYIATPHPAHKEYALLCLKAGKAVICEKPFTVNYSEAKEVIDYARKSKLFIMEAMWTRFLPAIVKLRELISKGTIGDINIVKADFGFRSDLNPEGRLFNLELGGGALLDVGIYTASFASMLFGAQPTEIKSVAHIGTTGVDEEISMLFGYNEGKMALLTGAIRTTTSQDAWIYGTEGYIHIPEFWHGKNIEVCIQGQEPKQYEIPFESTGYNYEATEVMNCLRAGKLESEVMSLNETLEIMKTMDTVRNQIGIKFPFEK
jgi:dihydrodiol dehydrogenase / D-xylose 1-dehydrogenase (NADP)